MSFHFRDRPRLSDRLRGKSADEIVKEFKDQIEKDKQMLFDRTRRRGDEEVAADEAPNDEATSDARQSPFARAGFMDDFPSWPHGFRHPGAFDHHRHQPWIDSNFEDAFARSGWPGFVNHPRYSRHQQPSFGPSARHNGMPPNAQQVPTKQDAEIQTDENPPVEEHGPVHAQIRKSPQYTHQSVSSELPRSATDPSPVMSEGQQRNSRAASAPPDCNSPAPASKRFVTKMEIHPVQPQSEEVNSPGKPPLPGKAVSSGTSTIRHIPIYVEGRDNVQSDRRPASPQPVRSKTPVVQQQESAIPLPAPPEPTLQPDEAIPMPAPPEPAPQPDEAIPMPAPQADLPAPHPNSPTQDQSSQASEPAVKDTLVKVEEIQKDVEGLYKEVESFKGNSRKDKEFLYLDEMLTRNLLKLDDIETEGQDDIRQARKTAIRSIQRCISLLESKTKGNEVPSEGSKPELEKTPAPLATEESTDICETKNAPQ